ncbi:MAG TPA: HD domain-containing protein [Gemmatimonadota bacterium]|nr:HD domain-containing protein [Gemmatimonadota bacterium]
MVGSRFVKAVERACQWHDGQVRKGTEVPYVSHLLAVAGLVLEAGGDEELAIAAMLHDAIEDQPDDASPEAIREEFGDRVAAVVVECSDREHGVKGTADNWHDRKKAYVQGLREASRDALLVSCADKLHNARSLLRDLIQEKAVVWDRFNQTDPVEQLWYYRALAEAFAERIRKPVWLPEELQRTVEEIATLAGVAPTRRA